MFSFSRNEVGFGSTMTTPENAMKIGFADDSVFVFEPVCRKSNPPWHDLSVLKSKLGL